MPTKEQVQVVIDTLTKSLEMLGDNLDMNNETLCGTHLCHGGHYAVAKGLSDEKKHTFFNGAIHMAKDLGFDTEAQLIEWVNNNPKIWGNNKGRFMFTHAKAFISNYKPKGAEKLSDIIQHWREVKLRLPE